MRGKAGGCPVIGVAVLLVTAGGAWAARPVGPAGEPPGLVRQIKVLTDKAPDCSTLKSMVESVTRGCRTNDEKAIAIYNFCLLAWYHRAYPSEKGGVPALKMMHAYGWSLCGGQHAALSALWRAAGWKWRFVGWPGHTTVEVFYDDQWHYYDTFLKIYVWRPDASAPGGRTVASQADIAANPQLILPGLVLDKARKVYYHQGNQFEVIDGKANWLAPAFLVCGDEPEGVIAGTKARRDAGSPTGWGSIKFDEDGYNTDVNLAPGMSLELLWEPIPGAHWFNGRKDTPAHTCGDKDYRNCPAIGPILEPYNRLPWGRARSFSSGRLVFEPDFANEASLAALAGKENVKLAGGRLAPEDAWRPASITVRMQSPYVMSRATGSADPPDSAGKAEISTDGGKTFRGIDLKDFSDAVGGQYDCLVRLSFSQPLKALKIEIIVQHNRCVLPYLSPGRNKVAVSAADAKALGGNRLVVTYAYCPGRRDRSYEEIAENSAELGRAHYAAWSDTPVVVQKAFGAADLPAEFTIDVPTPKDKYPVYPRMLFLRREVIAPGAKPKPLPQGAVEPAVGPNDELKELPNPFLIGTTPPPKKVQRPTVKREIPLTPSHVVSMDGQVFGADHFIKWRPKGEEAWVLLVGGDLTGLPRGGEIASAAVCIPVVNSITQATTQVGCTFLTAPFEKGKPYDFKNLGELAGTVNVPRQPGPGEPKYFRIDVTRPVKRIASGEAKFHGLAIRTVPNRSVDEGWTTRIDLSMKERTYLELEVFTGPTQ